MRTHREVLPVPPAVELGQHMEGLMLEVRWKAREVDGGQILQGSEYYWEVPCLELGFRKMNLAPV